MTIHYDDKGKYYTEVVSKDPVSVIIQTDQYRIVGDIHVRLDERIKDEMDRNERFIAVTDAVVFDLAGKQLHQVDFMVVNRAHIIYLFPNKSENESQGAAG
jgi:hypothetical protein